MPSNHLLPLHRWLLLSTLILGSACSRQQDPMAPGTDLATSPAGAISADYLQLQTESLETLTERAPEQAIAATKQLQTTVEQLLQSPNNERLLQARHDWNAAIAAYEHFYVFTRLGLIAPQSYQALTELDYRLAAWPIQPGYLDRFGPYTAVGLVYDIGLPLSEETLRQQHGLMDESDIALGFYALEFVLFGEQDARNPETLQAIDALDADQQHAGYKTVDELPENRRRQLIRLQVTLILDDLQTLQILWQPGRNNNLGTQFANLSSEQRVIALLRAGLAMLTEQIIALTEQTRRLSEDGEASNPQQNRQLAQRLIRQLNGWAQVLQQIDMQPRPKLVELTQACLDELQGILDQPLTNDEGNAIPIDWSETYSALSRLASAVRDLT